jgi:hypothetical protein
MVRVIGRQFRRADDPDWESMNRNPSVPRYAADLIGPMARQALSPDSSGTILDGYSRAVYLCSAGGELLWLAPGDIPMHRRGIRVQASLPRPPRDSAYRVADGTLLLGSAASIELSQARVWEPQRFAGSSQHIETEICTPDQLPMLPSPKGFGAFLPLLMEYAAGAPFPRWAPRRDPIVVSAYPAICGVASACRQHDLAALLKHADGLVGMGEGLTPSGDDYVGGVLFGLAMLREAGASLAWCSPGTVASFIKASKTRTNLISAALLGDHAAGHASEALHRFAIAFLIGRLAEAAYLPACDLIRIGHSTGWDLLTGAWTAMALVPSGAAPARRRAYAWAFAATT